MTAKQKQARDHALWLSPWCGLNEATFYAERAADSTQLPQTVFRAPEDGAINWRNAAALAPIFQRRTDLIVHATILPKRYFI